jgi:hypothetical protein
VFSVGMTNEIHAALFVEELSWSRNFPSFMELRFITMFTRAPIETCPEPD